MKTLSLILRIVAILAAVAATTLFFMAKGKLAEKESQLTATKQTLQAKEGDLATARADITQLENRLSAETEALANAKNQLESVRSEMYTARQEVSRTQQQLGQTRSKITELQQETENLKAGLAEAEKRAEQALESAGQNEELLTQIAELEASKTELENELELAKSRADMMANAGNQSGKDGAATGMGFQNSKALTRLSAETKIQSVSSENGLIVLHADPSLGLAPGQKLRLVRDLQALGSVEVSAVENSLAVANILPGTNTGSLEAGSKIQLFR